MILVMAFLDMVGVASIIPFMAVLANPAQVQANYWLAAIYNDLGFTQPESFLFFLGMGVFAALVLSIGFKALTTWALLHFTQMRNYSLGQRLVTDYLLQPYEWFLDRHSADLGKTVLSEVQLVINSALMPLMQMLAQGAVVRPVGPAARGRPPAGAGPGLWRDIYDSAPLAPPVSRSFFRCIRAPPRPCGNWPTCRSACIWSNHSLIWNSIT